MSKIPRPAILLSDVDNAEPALDQVDFVVLPITRARVEQMDPEPFVERLRLLSENREHARRFRGAMVFSFDGYDADPRELYQIPECSAFFRAVDRQWSYWLHFLEPSLIGIARALLDDVIVVSAPRSPIITAFFEPARAEQTYARLQEHARTLRLRHRLEDA